MRLNTNQLAIMAAILGISNAGMDSTFLGPYATVTPEKVRRYYAANIKRGITVVDAVHQFGHTFFESEKMADVFINEAQAWVKRLRDMDIEEVKTTFRYGEFVDAIREGQS